MAKLDFPRRCLSLRKALGLSQDEIASLCNMTGAYWSSMESGKISPSLAMLTRISDGLQIPLSLLLTSKLHLPEKYRDDPIMYKLMAHAKNLTPESMDMATLFINHMKRQYS